MQTGTIRLFDKENKCGCVQDDADHSVHFFDRACFAPNYIPRKGDRVAYIVRTNLRNGRPEAHLTQLVAAT